MLSQRSICLPSADHAHRAHIAESHFVQISKHITIKRDKADGLLLIYFRTRVVLLAWLSPSNTNSEAQIRILPILLTRNVHTKDHDQRFATTDQAPTMPIGKTQVCRRSFVCMFSTLVLLPRAACELMQTRPLI